MKKTKQPQAVAPDKRQEYEVTFPIRDIVTGAWHPKGKRLKLLPCQAWPLRKKLKLVAAATGTSKEVTHAKNN